jgi:cell division protein FtsA
MIGKKNEYGKLEILESVNRLGVARVVNNITQTIQSIQQAIQEAENNSGYKIRCCSRGGSTSYAVFNTRITSVE